MRLHRQDLLENFQKGEKQNILIVAEAYYPLIGGATVVADNLAKEYAKTCNVAVVTGDCRYEDKAEYPVIRCTGIGQGSNGTLPLPALDGKFKRLMRKLPIDAVHIHSYFGLAKFAVRLAKKRGIPVVIHGHSQLYNEYITIVHMKWLAKLLHKRAIRLFNRADEVLAVSETLADIYRSTGCKVPVRVMRNATEFTYLDHPAKIAAVREKYAVPEDKPVFLYLGRLAAECKNLDFLLDALAAAANAGTEYRMLFVGGGPDAARLQNRAAELGLSERTLFLGDVADREEREALYQMSDLFLFPSVRDSSPLVKHEAASQGTPMLCISGTSVSEDVKDGENGFTAENSVTAYAKRIGEILADKETLRRVGENARETLGVSWEVPAKQCLHLFGRLAARPLRQSESVWKKLRSAKKQPSK